MSSLYSESNALSTRVLSFIWEVDKMARGHRAWMGLQEGLPEPRGEGWG